MLQTRVGKRTGAAALRMAVDMTKGTGKGAERWKISKRGGAHPGHRRPPRLGAAPAVLRHRRRSSPRASRRRRARPSARSTSPPTTPRPPPRRGEKVILVRSETSPEDVHGMMVAEGILTARGGLVSHAAVVARGWGTPAVVGAEAVQDPGKSFTVERRHRQRGRLHLARRLVRRGRARPDGAGRAPSRRRSSTIILGWADAVRSQGQAPAGRAGQRRHRRGRHQRPPARRRGHRPVPHRAHVPRPRPPARRAPDDPGQHRRARRPRRSRSCARSSRTTSRRSSRRWTACRSRCACSTRRCTSSCRRSRSCASSRPRPASTTEEKALLARGRELVRAQPDDRHPRRAPRRHQARASTRMQVRALLDAAADAAQAGQEPDRRDHDPAHRHPRGAAPGPRWVAGGDRPRPPRACARSPTSRSAR